MRLRSLARRVQRLEAGRAGPGEVRLGRGMAGLRAALDRLDASEAAELPRQSPDTPTGLLTGVADAPPAIGDAAETHAASEPHADGAHR